MTDIAPGQPTDCALAKHIRAHIVHMQLVQSLVSAGKPARAADLFALLSDLPHDHPAVQDAINRPALLRRQAE
jgi:hypothetical protein